MEIFGSNTPAAVQYLLAFVIILGLLAAFAALLRRITGGRARVGFSGTSARHRQQRLGIVDAVDIDSQRQLLLLRRDNVEHLVMVGGPNDLLVESGIGRMPYRAPGPQSHQPHHAPASTEGSMPDVGEQGFASEQAARDLPAHISAPAEGEPVRAPARMEMPQPNVAEPSAGLSAGRSPAMQRPLATPLAPPLPIAPAAPFAPATRSVASPTLPPAQPPMPPVPPVMPAAPSVGLPTRDVAGKAPGVQSLGVQVPAGFGAGLGTEPLSPPASIFPSPAAAPSQAAGPATTREQEVPQRPLSGVTRQLEEALKRPFGAVRPSPVTGIKLDDAPAAKEAGETAGAGRVEVAPSFSGVQVDIRATREVEVSELAKKVPASSSVDRPMAAPYTPPSPISPVFPTRIATPAPAEVELTRPAPALSATHAVTPPPQAPSAKDETQEKGREPVKVEAPEAPSEKAPAPAAPKPGAPKAPAFDLTSLENIEAEFARLLGRTPPKGE